MNRFHEFAKEEKKLDGDKERIDDILNKQRCSRNNRHDMIQLTKKYRCVYKGVNILFVDEFSLTSVTGCTNGIETDTKEEMNSKIEELGLMLTEEQKTEWDKLVEVPKMPEMTEEERNACSDVTEDEII